MTWWHVVWTTWTTLGRGHVGVATMSGRECLPKVRRDVPQKVRQTMIMSGEMSGRWWECTSGFGHVVRTTRGADKSVRFLPRNPHKKCLLTVTNVWNFRPLPCRCLTFSPTLILTKLYWNVWPPESSILLQIRRKKKSNFWWEFHKKKFVSLLYSSLHENPSKVRFLGPNIHRKCC